MNEFLVKKVGKCSSFRHKTWNEQGIEKFDKNFFPPYARMWVGLNGSRICLSDTAPVWSNLRALCTAGGG